MCLLLLTIHMVITHLESAAFRVVSNAASNGYSELCVNAALSFPDTAPTVARALYDRLWRSNAVPDLQGREAARAFINHWREKSRDAGNDLPSTPAGLGGWLQANLADTGERYRGYLTARKDGAPRRYFSNRSHALYFLRSVAPTKLVDGAWLYGLLNDSGNPRLSDLLFTYVEELGDGDPAQNHVLLYRRLMASLGIGDWPDQPDGHYVQGALQLSLAACTDTMLPEVIGFNLGYEQLPLHLLITAYELDELGIDPTYFSLHVTVDNAAGGHAQRALRSVTEAFAASVDPRTFWHRLEDGYRLSNAGWGTTDAIGSFDGHAEFVRILQSRAAEGAAVHSDHCRIEGRTVNEWLAVPDGASAFIEALMRKGWLQRSGDPAHSRFWQMLQGDGASMFGVFGDYELQVIYDWIRADGAADGASFARGRAAPVPARAFRHARRLATPRPITGLADLAGAPGSLDPDVAELRRVFSAKTDPGQRGALLRRLLGPAFHWSPAGLEATRHVASVMRAVQ
jgi:hypothetical protein